MVALIVVFLVAMTMSTLALANAQGVLHGAGCQEGGESHAQSAE